MRSVLKASICLLLQNWNLLGYNFESTGTEESTKKFINTSTIYQISPEVEIETINLRKTTKMKLPDAIIAATAIVNKFTLISANTKDFKSVISLNLLNPFEL